MKKQTINNIAKRFFFGNILAAFVFISANNKVVAQSSNAQPVSVTSTSTNSNVQVKYLSAIEDAVLLSVKYNNTTSGIYTVKVADQFGETLYENDFTNKQFDKKFQIPKSMGSVTISVTNYKDKTNQSFAINIGSKVIEDVVVRRN